MLDAECSVGTKRKDDLSHMPETPANAALINTKTGDKIRNLALNRKYGQGRDEYATGDERTSSMLMAIV